MKPSIAIKLGAAALLACLVLAGLFMGCQQSRGPSGPDPSGEPPPTIGDVHTEVLTEIYAGLDRARAAKGRLDERAELAVVVAAVNAISDRYGSERMSPEAIMGHVEQGRQAAQQDLWAQMAELLGPAELQWWDRFSWEAELCDARAVYLEHCRLYGAPAPGSTLSQVVDIALSSADFWWDYRGEEQPVYSNPYLPQPKPTWKQRLLRFGVNVLVDGVAGGLAGVGGGGPVGAGIVGGLASYGADTLLFGG